MRKRLAQSGYTIGARRLLTVSVSAVAIAMSAAFIGAPAFAEKRDVVIRVTPEAQRVETPITLLVSIRKQRIRLFDGTNEITSSRISSGQPGFDTPTGVFSILEKKQYHESNIYDGAPMPFMQRVTWSGIALHAGVVPGYRASHGCIRLPYSFAKSLFGRTKVGARVIITQDETSLVRFDDDRLFKPLPAGLPPAARNSSSSDKRLALNDAPAGQESQIPSLVTPAMAEISMPPPQPQKPRTRAEAAQMHLDKLQSLQGALKAAETKKVEASEKAQAALKAAQEVEARYNTVRQPFEAVLRASDNAQAARAAAVQQFRAFLASPRPVSNDPAVRLKQEDMELEFEDRILDATIEADAAKAQSAAAELSIAEVKAAYATAAAAKERAVDEVKSAMVQLRSAQAALIEAQKEAALRDKTLAVFISLKTQRIYMRQGFEPVLEAPIEVDENPGAIGTHVLTALNYDASGDKFSWQLVTAQAPRIAAQSQESNRKKKRESVAVAGLNSPINQEAVRVALDSVKIPQEIQDKITELARPGMSLIISDRDLSNETGKGTEFVLLTR